MATRPASHPSAVPAGIAILCVLAIATGWLLLRGAPFVYGVPAMAAILGATLLLLSKAPRDDI